MILKIFGVGALFFAAFAGSSWGWRAFGSAKLDGFVRGILVFVTGLAILALADAAYFEPRSGGYIGYALEGMMGGSEAGAVMGELGALRSALSIYYGDTEGKYPQSLDVLWKDRKRYFPHPLRHADVYAYGKKPGAGIERAHWRRDTAKIKNFFSAQDSDDSGGWGYVNDPASPQYGNVFVNCTHINLKTSYPWNIEGPPAKVPAAAEPPAAAAERQHVDYVRTGASGPAPAIPRREIPRKETPVNEPARNEAPRMEIPQTAGRPDAPEGSRGVVMAAGMKAVIAGADLVFTSENGGQTFSAKTAANGRYAIGLPAGRYRVSASHPDYQPSSSVFIVKPGVYGTGNLFLKPR